MIEAEKYVMKNGREPLIFRLGILYGMGYTYSRISVRSRCKYID